MSVYDDARAALIEKHKKVPGVLALLEFGTIPLPGISDIDFFIVVEPNRTIVLPRFREYPEDQQYAMNSLQCVITPDTYKHLTHYDPWFVDVKTRFDATGQFSNFRKAELSAPDYAALSLHFVFEKLVYGCLPFIADVRSFGTIQVRRFFEEAKQSKYFLREFDRTGVKHPEDPAMGAADSAARDWFTMPEADRKPRINASYEAFERSTTAIMSSLGAHLASVSLRPVEKLSPWHALQKKWLARYPRSLVIHTPGRIFVYQEGRTAVTLGTETIGLPGQASIPVTTIVMPLSFAAMATQHLFMSGGLSDYYRSCACTDLPAVPFYDNDALMFLHELQNRNLQDTRNVRNCKLYEMRFGYRPQPDCLSLGSRLSRMLQTASAILLRSPFHYHFVREYHREVWSAKM